MNYKAAKELKEKIEAEAKEDFDFEQHLFKNYPSLFNTGEDGELLPYFQRCCNDCPKGWELIVDHLCGSIINYIENTSCSVINPKKKTKAWVYRNIWNKIHAHLDRIFNPYKDNKIKLNPIESAEQRAKNNKKFSMKVRKFTTRVNAWFLSEMYTYNKPKQVKVAQYKEKFGGLRFYIDGGDDYVEGMIRFAQYLVSMTCQQTGEAGDLCKKGSWYATLSPAKAQQLGFSAIKEQ